MDKAYSRINWQNQPSAATALGATNLNRIDVALNEVDNRVVTMDQSKANVSEVNTLVRDITFNTMDGSFTILFKNGITKTIDTAIEKIATNFTFNSATQSIDLILSDGSTQSIDISSFISNVDFATSETIDFTEDENGKTKADVVNGSITEEKIEAGLLAELTTQAIVSTQQANVSKRYAVGGVEIGDDVDNSKYYKEQAANYADIASQYAPFTYPNVYIDLATGELMSVGGQNISLTIDEDGNLISEVTI